RANIRVANIIHNLSSKDLKGLNARERRTLNRVLKNKPAEVTLWGHSRDVSRDIDMLRNKLILIKQSDQPSPKNGLITKILNTLGFLTQSQKLHKISGDIWNQAHPKSVDKCVEAI